MRHDDPHRDEPILFAGADLTLAKSVFVLLHGRGASAADILALGSDLADQHTALIAPQAASNSWYPYSFLAPIQQNQPWLDSAIRKVFSCIAKCAEANMVAERIAIIGFSQGACLATKFVASHPSRYGALIAFTGALPGPVGASLHHVGDLRATPVLLSSGDPDPHVPWHRVEETEATLARMGAVVRLIRHPNRPHTILNSELVTAKSFLVSAGLVAS